MRILWNPKDSILKYIDRSEFDGLYELNWETGMLSSYFCAILSPLLDLDVAILSPECYFKTNVLITPFFIFWRT